LKHFKRTFVEQIRALLHFQEGTAFGETCTAIGNLIEAMGRLKPEQMEKWADDATTNTDRTFTNVYGPKLK